MSKGLEALESLETEYYTKNGVRFLEFRDDDERLNIIEKELKAFDFIKENFDIEAIVIKDYCYIEIASKICVMSKTQRAIKINPENKNKVEALEVFGKC
jgi:hypothetical protein